jgi:hypothetical protein
MRKVSQSFLAAAAIVGAVSSANAARSIGPDVTFVTHHENKVFNVQTGVWTKIDTAGVHCRSATGCLLSIATVVGCDSGYQEVRSLVDGIAAEPPPVFAGPAGISRQSAILTKGSHMIETDVNATQSNTNCGPWDADYTVYEHYHDTSADH